MSLPIPKNFALGSLQNDSLNEVEAVLPRRIPPSRFELLVNPVPIVPWVAVPEECGCKKEEEIETELLPV